MVEIINFLLTGELFGFHIAASFMGICFGVFK